MSPTCVVHRARHDVDAPGRLTFRVVLIAAVTALACGLLAGPAAAGGPREASHNHAVGERHFHVKFHGRPSITVTKPTAEPPGQESVPVRAVVDPTRVCTTTGAALTDLPCIEPPTFSPLVVPNPQTYTIPGTDCTASVGVVIDEVRQAFRLFDGVSIQCTTVHSRLAAVVAGQYCTIQSCTNDTNPFSANFNFIPGTARSSSVLNAAASPGVLPTGPYCGRTIEPPFLGDVRGWAAVSIDAGPLWFIAARPNPVPPGSC